MAHIIYHGDDYVIESMSQRIKVALKVKGGLTKS